MIKKIKLLGSLGKRFGREYSMDVSSPAEAVRALCFQIKGFKSFMSEGKGASQKFKVVVGKEVIDPNKQLRMQTSNDISIVPIIAGSGGNIGGGLMIIAGAALIYFSGGIGTPLGASMVAAGAGLIVGGAMAFFMKTPSAPDPSDATKTDRSYIFNGAVNTVQQGQPIPIGYGRMLIGSQVISASISTVQVPI